MHTHYAYGQRSTNWWTLKEWLRKLEPFQNNPRTFTGIRIEEPCSPTVGKLYMYPEDAKRLDDACNAGFVDYIIYSYATPIAWHHTEDGWIDPGHGYTQTTKAKHYGPTAVAIAELLKGN